MDLLEQFNTLQLVPEQALRYGFKPLEHGYQWRGNILNGDYQLIVEVHDKGQVSFQVWDVELDEAYQLIHAEQATGCFIGAMREAIQQQLDALIEACFVSNVYQWPQTLRLLEWVAQSYQIVPDYPWEKYPANGILRHQSNQKWFGLVMVLDGQKISEEHHGRQEVVLLKARPEQVVENIQIAGIYPAYHMNKRHWYMVVLDDTIEDVQLYHNLEESFALTKHG